MEPTRDGDTSSSWSDPHRPRSAANDRFVEYYARQSQTAETRRRFTSIRDAVQRIVRTTHGERGPLDVLDIGCGAGMLAMIWAESGHRAHGLDVNRQLLELGRQRALEAGLNVDWRVGSALALPWGDEAMDVCLALGFLEHVAAWETCLDELVRVLRPGGVLFLSTTNKLCPVQQEFNLPLYSWYPRALKRRYEQLASSARPELVNFTSCPAVNWFTFYGLRDALAARGCQSMDRFDLIDLSGKGRARTIIIHAVRRIRPLRWLAHVATPYTLVAALKPGR
jgi:2-polyprenyl-6-hydroxyphenyl methylase/3-demethylubiquinone-9 3-methyltransferase